MKEPIFYKIVRPLLFLFTKLKFRPIVINKENIPKSGRVILAGNHTNNYDCFTLGVTTKRCIRYVAKSSLMKGFKGIIFKGLGIIPVNRNIKDKSVIPTCVRYLEKEAIIGIFPEGTINRTNDIIMPFKKGAIVMSLRSNCPIVPFAINGNYKKGKLKIILGEAYIPESNDVERETKLLEEKVIKLLNAIGDK
ncbi:MAG: lysophospholipid acyltransferase family protein [bacterium]|nr:lysophospholipid acyltransferase family protein [bacterium]